MKYPRTPHLPSSPGATEDDVIWDQDLFTGLDVVVTEKLDGENTTMTSTICHARSLDSKPHESRTWVKQIHGEIKGDIPKNWRICGENMYARHSLPYNKLPGYFCVFSIWDDHNVCLSWDDTLEWCSLLNLPTVPVLYRGIWIPVNYKPKVTLYGDGESEGYVVRLSKSFPYSGFSRAVAKYVRKGHVTTSSHWRAEKVIPNHLSPVKR